MLRCHAYLIELYLVLLVRLRLLEFLGLLSHTLLIAAKIMQVQKSIGTPTKVKLNISQLTLAKFAQSGRHESDESVKQGVPES